MTTQPQPLPIPTAHRPTGRRIAAALAGAGAILVLVVGIGVWQTGRPSATDSSVSPLTTATAPPVTRRAVETVPTIYLVGSQAQAQVVHTALEEANAVLVTSGEATLTQQVEWFDSTEAEARFQSTLQEINLLRNYEGLAPISVIDLRGLSVASTAAAANGSAGAAITSGPASSTLYLVDSAEEEALIRAFPGGLDQLRPEEGAPPIRTAVLVGSTLDRAALEQLPGTPGTRIVDLRAPAPVVTRTDALGRELDALTAEGLGAPRAP